MKIQLPDSIVIGTGEVEVLNSIRTAAWGFAECPDNNSDPNPHVFAEHVLGVVINVVRLTYSVHPVPASEPIPLPWREVECDELGITHVIQWITDNVVANGKRPGTEWALAEPFDDVVLALSFARQSIATAFAEARLQEVK